MRSEKCPIKSFVDGQITENFQALKAIGVEEDDGGVRFSTGNTKMAVLRMRNKNVQ
jgi:hypothetical protein